MQAVLHGAPVYEHARRGGRDPVAKGEVSLQRRKIVGVVALVVARDVQHLGKLQDTAAHLGQCPGEHQLLVPGGRRTYPRGAGHTGEQERLLSLTPEAAPLGEIAEHVGDTTEQRAVLGKEA